MSDRPPCLMTNIMLKLLFIRHGESIGNCEKRMAGRSDDRLTATGLEQCRQLGRWLYQQGWQPSHIYSSPLRRAIESVAALITPWSWQLPELVPKAAKVDTSLVGHISDQEVAAARQATPQFRLADQLQEFDMGILTGLTWAEAQQQYPDLCQALVATPNWIPIPDAETPNAGRDRADQFIRQLLDQHSHQDAIWIISHHWIMEHLIASLMGCDRTWQINIPNTGIFEFWLDCDRWSDAGISSRISDLWQIKHFAACPHLSNNFSAKSGFSQD